MAVKYVTLLLLFSILACSHPATFDQQKEEEKIKIVLSNQQDAWNTGSIDEFMKGYWQSDSLSFIGSRGLTYGWQNTLDNYKKGYPDTLAMGKLSFEILSLSFFNSQNARMVGKYILQRKEDTPSGYFTLIWQYKDGKWVITSDQTCG